ncbi:MAG: DinB family protein [Acidobacteria bacterium]|nr:DinB family protein [Acidobacteriota bacterium]MBV9070146.1 DinB family protein [Acidobacteriota bacterium]MBV9186321.1 DinB family protein [Acidobacteriota bacterium]
MNVIDRLEQTPNRVRELIAGRTEEDLSFKPAPDAFSLRENLLHLRDIDVEGYEVRIVGLLDERGPREFPDIDGAVLARERNYNVQPVAPALEDFAASRARSIARLRESTDLKRYGRVGERAVSLETLLQDWTRHDSEHLAEMTHLTVSRYHPVDLLYGRLNPGKLVDEILTEMRGSASFMGK